MPYPGQPYPKPSPRPKAPPAPLQRSEWGAKKKAAVQSEAQQAKTLEGTEDRVGLFGLHHVDFLHLSTPMRDKGTLKAGHPDYLLLGVGPDGSQWSAYLEIKAKNLLTGRSGRVEPHQRAFHDRLRAAGHDVMVAVLPADLAAVNDWLSAKTGRVVNLDGLLDPQEARR